MTNITALVAEIEAGLEGATPGPWTTCSERCECTNIACKDYPVANVVKGDWGDDYPSLLFKEGFTGSIKPPSVEPYMAQSTYGTVPVGEAMANRSHIARCSPDNIRALIAKYREMEKALEPFAQEATEPSGAEAEDMLIYDDDQIVGFTSWKPLDLTFGHFRAARAARQGGE